MADTDAGGAESASAPSAPSQTHENIPSSSAAPPAPSPPETATSLLPFDPLAKALQTLFVNVTTLVRGELQAANSEYELLERMNLRVASEHDNQADFAEGLRVFVERLKQKNEGFSEYTQQIDEIDQEVTELEALVSTLDNYTSNLESKIRIACTPHHGRHFI
jgi:biogenesis of lysosome-related organelles complex 1 subunit 2